MNLKKLMKMLEAETDKEKAAEVLRKIDSLIIRKGVLRICSNGYLKPLAVESHICKRDAFENDYFDCDTWGYTWGYPVRRDCIYIQPDYAGIEIVLSMNEEYVVSEIVKSAYIRLNNGINNPAADQKQIGELFKKIGFPRIMYNHCAFDLFTSASAADKFVMGF